LLTRRPTLFQHSLDHSPGDFGAKPRHCRPIGERKDIGRLERLIDGVDEGLADGHTRQQAVDPGANVHRLERQMAPLRQERAEASVFAGRGRGTIAAD
jgi:hypothetical protein